MENKKPIVVIGMGDSGQALATIKAIEAMDTGDVVYHSLSDDESLEEAVKKFKGDGNEVIILDGEQSTLNVQLPEPKKLINPYPTGNPPLGIM